MKRLLIITLLATAIVQLQARPGKKITIDSNLPAGNIVVEKISGDTVYVQPDMSGHKGEWFYWAMRVRGAQGRTLVFMFPRTCVGVRGPVVSLDKGKTFFFGGGRTGKTFTWTFGPKDKDVFLYECHPYLPGHWKQFLRSIGKGQFETNVLCLSRSGYKVPFATFGRLDGKEKHRVVISARHHCSETMAGYVMEGIIQGICSDDKTGKWLREKVEFTVVPFVDYDGAVNGDQGKNRDPHDHNRDYGQFIYPETRALADKYLEKDPEVIIDLHCPWISSGVNEFLYNPLSNPEITPDIAAEEFFTKCIEKNAEGLPYDPANNVPFGTSWNTNANYADGLSCLNWARLNVPGARVCRCFEIPFANAGGTEVNPESCRVFGKSLASALVDLFNYL